MYLTSILIRLSNPARRHMDCSSTFLAILWLTFATSVDFRLGTCLMAASRTLKSQVEDGQATYSTEKEFASLVWGKKLRTGGDAQSIRSSFKL